MTDLFNVYHPASPDADRPRLCPTCGAWGNAPCVGPKGPRKAHRSRPVGFKALVPFPSERKPKKRKNLNGPALRSRLRDRDGDLCWLCHEPMVFVDRPGPSGQIRRMATIDHVIPVSAGGTNAQSNLRLAHRECNGRRGSTPVDP